MSRTKRWLHLVELDTKRIVKTYTVEDYDEEPREDDPFIGSYPPSLISGRAQAQPQRNETAAHDSTTTLQEAGQ